MKLRAIALAVSQIFATRVRCDGGIYGNGTIQTANIANGAITNAKLAANAVTESKTLAGTFTSASLAASVTATLVQTGSIVDFGSAGLPATGYLACDGSNVSRATYAALFASVSTTWGVGDGVTTFGLPDARRKVRGGSGGVGTGTLGNATGNTGGAETVALTVAQLAVHAHNQKAYQSNPSSATGANTSSVDAPLVDSGTATVSAGSGTAHDNIQPTMICTVGIKT